MERKKRRWWTRGITWLSLVAIGGALLSGLFQLAVALAPDYRDELAAKASTALGQPVQVDELSLRWRWLWPLLELEGLRLMDAEGRESVATIERVRLGFSLLEMLRGEWVPAEVEVTGLTLALQRTADGQLRLKGRVSGGRAPSFAEVAAQIKRFSRLRASAVALTLEDQTHPEAGFAATLQKADLRLSEQGFELRAELAAPQALASRLRLRAGFTGDLAEPAGWQGRWSLDATGLVAGAPLAARWPALAALRLGEARVDAAGDWQAGQPGASELSFAAQAMQLDHTPGSALREVDIGLRYRPTATGATLDVVPLRLTGARGTWPVSSARLQWQREAGKAAPAYSGSGEFLRLDDLAPWLAAFWPDAAQRPLLASLAGDLTGLEGRWQQGDAAPRYRLHGRFAKLGARWGERLAFDNASGELTADESGGELDLKSPGMGLQLPQTFENAMRFDALDAKAQWRRQGEAWQLTLPGFAWSLLGSEGRGNAEMRLKAGERPVLKLAAEFDARDAAALKPLMPRHWGQSLKDWLTRAVVRGRVSKARLAIDGPMADFPFHKNPTGRWSLLLPISGTRLEYQREWPGVDQLAATLRFAGNGLAFEAQRGLISGVAVTTAKGRIEDFAHSPLVIDGTARGEAAAGYAFLRASPLATRLAGLLRHSEAAGPTEADIHLEIPLHAGTGQKTVASGTVRLAGNLLQHTALDAPVTDITGSLRFGGDVGVAAQEITGRFHGTPVTARIAANAQGADELAARFAVTQGADSELPRRYLPRWLASRLEGTSDFQLALPLSGPDSGHTRLTSDLVGTAIRLPPPLAKPADAPLPLALKLEGSEAAPLAITGSAGERLGLALRFARATPGALAVQGIHLRFGAGVPALPAEKGLVIEGALASVDPRDWRGLMQELKGEGGKAGSAESGIALLDATLDIGQLRLQGFELREVRVNARREYGGYAARFTGPGTEGSAKLTPRGDALTARFARLALKPLPKQAATATPAGDEPATDPRDAPVVDASVEALEIGGAPFGRLALVSERSASGQKLRELSLSGGIASLKAEGDWRRTGGMTEARSRFTLASDDLAGTLQAFGFAPNISGQKARIEGDLAWPAAARGLEWAQGRGTVSLSVEKGTLRTVEPGGGRVLGLFNFYALPRRLAFDFRDVVSTGLAFDRIEGNLALANGIARTNDLTVRSPSVKIAVRGEIGLASQTYDQIITVTPNTSGLTLGALLLGGAGAVAAPVLPIIAVIANQVIDLPLGQVTQLSYGLTGSWDNPEIRKIEPTNAAARP